ncbi:MAG TPA: hypothetical protein VFX30_02425 [bacterium]|nr:hypothetical protein [bacterium]
MVTASLSTAQTQLLNHVLAWGSFQIVEITLSPLTPPEPSRRTSATPPLLPSERALQYLERMRQKEGPLLKALGFDPANVESEVSRKDGPSLNTYFWIKKAAWLSGETGEMGRRAADDLWQIRQARQNVFDRVTRWKKIFGSNENHDSRINVLGLDENLSWLQDTYALRHFFVQQLERKYRPAGWDLVVDFYDPAQRAAHNILESAAALKKYHKVNVGNGT